MSEVYENANNSIAEKAPFKAYATAPGEANQKVLVSSSEEEILERLRSWNVGRPADNQFETCNIGKLQEDGRYGDYHKFEVASGKDISNIYLTLPKLEKEAYLKLIEELKNHGAKYNANQQRWYVPHDADMQKFAEYIPPQETPDNSTAKEETMSETSGVKKHESTNIINDCKRNGIAISRDTFDKVQQLNQLTHKNNSLVDISVAFKTGIYADNPDVQGLVTEIGQYFQTQQIMAMAAPVMG